MQITFHIVILGLCKLLYKAKVADPYVQQDWTFFSSYLTVSSSHESSFPFLGGGLSMTNHFQGTRLAFCTACSSLAPYVQILGNRQVALVSLVTLASCYTNISVKVLPSSVASGWVTIFNRPSQRESQDVSCCFAKTTVVSRN